MAAPRSARLVAATATVAAAVALGAAAAPAETGRAAAAKITPRGVGAVRLGATFRALRDAGAVGRLRRGCELGGPDTRSARLRAPLAGSVDFTPTSPRKVTSILVSGGATARGVGVGATAAAVRRAFPKARFDHRTEDVFGITLVRVPRGGGGRLQLAVDAGTRKVTAIGIPFIAFCE